MSKYLPEYGWQPIIYTALNPEYPILDHSLEKDVLPSIEVIRYPIWEPYNLYKRFTGIQHQERVYSGFLSESKPRSLAQKLSIWIRGNFFIPDARCFWVKPSIKFLLKELKQNPVDAIVSTGTPHSMHLIGLGLKKKLGIKWLADFRDPWTNIDFYQDLKLTKWADARHHQLEREVLTIADHVTTVSWHWAEELGSIGKRKVDVITNGFDEQDYSTGSIELDKKFSISHIGLLSAERSLTGFWSSLQELLNEIPEFKDDLKIRLVGKVDYEVFGEIEKFGLTSHIEHIQYVPHDEAILIQQKSAVLLLVLNNVANVLGHIPGKLFEYLAAKRPILGIGPSNGDASRIVNELHRGKFFGFQDTQKIKSEILKLYHSHKVGILNDNYVEVESYARRNLASQVGRILLKM